MTRMLRQTRRRGGAMLEALESRTLLAAFPLVDGHFAYTDNYGSTVTITLTGGDGEVHFTGDDPIGVPSSILITPTTAKSTLTFTVKSSDKNIKGTEVRDLVVDDAAGFGLRTIRAAEVNLTGDMTMNASAGAAITLGYMTNNATLTLSGASSNVTTLTLAYVNSGCVIEAAGLPLAVSALGFQSAVGKGASVSALYFTKFDVRGDIESAAINALGANSKGISIDNLTVKGDFLGTITAAGRLNRLIFNDAQGSITAASIGTLTTKLSMQASLDVISLDNLNVRGTLMNNTITATGRINKITADSIDAATITAAAIGSINAKNNIGFHNPAAITATGRINSITANQLRGSITAATIGSIATKGPMSCDVTLTAADARGTSLNTLKVGTYYCGSIDVLGRVNTIAVGSIEAGSITAASIGTLTTLGFKGGKGNLFATVGVTGKVDVLRMQSTASLVPVPDGRGSLTIQGGCVVHAKNGTFIISGAQTLYIV